MSTGMASAMAAMSVARAASTGRPQLLYPGVPAAGHVTAQGFWHPGRTDGCVKCPDATEDN